MAREHVGMMEDHSGWLRPAYYLQEGETEDRAIDREIRSAQAVALLDSSSLGKLEVRGADAAEFLNRLYVNDVKTLEAEQFARADAQRQRNHH